MNWADLLHRCDRARYLPDEPLDAFEDLHEAVAADREAAESLLPLLPTMTRCSKCAKRWRVYLLDALVSTQQQAS